MSAVFVIGLFRSLQRKFDADCVRLRLSNSKVLADIGSKGTLTLLPIENDAVHALDAYVDSLSGYEDAHVIVLPYAPIPNNLEQALEVLSQCGGTVIRADNGQDGWPSLARKTKPDTQFINSVYQRFWQGMPSVVSVEETLPSEYFRQVADANSRIIFAEEVFATCDLVAPHRRDFLRRAVDALVEFVADGSGGRIDAFFRERALEHAQTGGISATVKILRQGVSIHSATAKTHLKQGDKTTPEGAARLYYQVFIHDGLSYAAIIYAGPHPDKDVSCTCTAVVPPQD